MRIQKKGTTGALMFSPPTCSPSNNATRMAGPSDNQTADLFNPHLFVPVTFSPQFFCPPLRGGGHMALLGTRGIYSNLLTQLVRPSCAAYLGQNITGCLTYLR